MAKFSQRKAKRNTHYSNNQIEIFRRSANRAIINQMQVNLTKPDPNSSVSDKDKDSGGGIPLAERMRPTDLLDYEGQTHLLGEGRLLRRAIEADRFTSIILHGPAGSGKTSLAEIIAKTTNSRFERASGATSNVAELRKIILAAKEALVRGRRTVLFIDEIHRFSKSQQDVLLPDVEQGTIRLIGATSLNPLFYVNGPLVSRSMVFELRALSEAEIITLAEKACGDKERGLGRGNIVLDREGAEALAEASGGDARRCLNALELAALTTPQNELGEVRITKAVVEEVCQRKIIVHDKDGDGHYDTISAFIKSIRGGDPDAALYWLAKMLQVGEDVRFISRRLVIAASEDIGLADSRGLLVAIGAQTACESVGLPEAEIALAHATVYLATAPKSNSAHEALLLAKQEVEKGATLAIPENIKSSANRKEAYKNPHDFHGGIVPQAYLPGGKVFYTPTDRGEEKRIGERLAYWRSFYNK